MVFQRSMLDWRGWGQSAMGICALCYIWNVFGVMVFQRSMLDWRGWGQSARGICALCYIWNWFGVMVFQRSMLNCRRGSISHGYISIVLYMKCIWCNGFAKIYAQLQEGVNLPWVYVHCAIYIRNFCGVMVFQRSMLDWRRGVGSICHRYMCIVLYIKPVWCHGFAEIYAQLQEGVNLPWVYVHCAIYIRNFCGVMVFQRSMLDWRRG